MLLFFIVVWGNKVIICLVNSNTEVLKIGFKLFCKNQEQIQIYILE